MVWLGDAGLRVVNGSAGFQGPGWPNGPPSPRLAPGGFYVSPRTEDGLILSRLVSLGGGAGGTGFLEEEQIGGPGHVEGPLL